MSDWLFVLGLCAPVLCVIAGFAGLLLAARPVELTRPSPRAGREEPLADVLLRQAPPSHARG